MKFLIALGLLALAFISAFRALSSASTERLLWGLLASSVGLGLAVQLYGDGYYGLLMVAVFVLTDLMLYLFFRSLNLLPAVKSKSIRGDRAFRVFFLWISFCAIAGVTALAFSDGGSEIWAAPARSEMSLLADRIWSADWLLSALPILGLVVLATGGFFLVRRER